MEPIIKIKNLNFTYNLGQVNEFKALLNVSFEIYPEEFIILYGPSGCGKSTLLNIIAGLETPDFAAAFVNGIDLAKMTKRQHANYHRKTIGMIFQAYNLISSLTVLDNVALPQIFMSERKRQREIIGLELLERFGIRKQANKLPAQLSGGQQQRIGIARSIVNNPDIILADEPVGNLDSISAKNVLEILKDLNEKEKKTVIMVTHNPENLEYADRVFHMKDGIIIKETVNQDKDPIKKKEELPKAPTGELNDLMRSYSGLSPEQINILIMPYKAKVFAHHFITNRNLEETKIFEDVMQRRLMDTIDTEEFYETLNRPANEGGVGYDLRTAAKITKNVGKILNLAKFVYQQHRQGRNAAGEHEIIPEKEKSEKIAKFLLDFCFTEYTRKIDEVRINRLMRIVHDRVIGQISKPELYKFLDQPFSSGGIGLNSKTARFVTETLEMILILGYGLAQKTEMLKIQHAANGPKVFLQKPQTVESAIISEQESLIAPLGKNFGADKEV
jgi:putative ABC transport system ATP-binding protein